jgi:hypothetical protein
MATYGKIVNRYLTKHPLELNLYLPYSFGKELIFLDRNAKNMIFL